jgi:hypothetical protein
MIREGDTTSLEAEEMRFVRSVKGDTRSDKTINEVIRNITRGLWNIRCEIQIQTKLDQPSRKNGQQTDCRNAPSNINLEEEEIMDDIRNDGNASITEQVKRPNLWKVVMMIYLILPLLQSSQRDDKMKS